MKKYFLFALLVAIMPNLCFGASARYTQLVREKQRKMEELEKCMGVSKGLKIAGVSTLGLTAVGVVGNVYEASELKKYDSQIASKDKAIEKTKQEIAEKEAAEKTLIECKVLLTTAGAQNADKITTVKKENEECKILTCAKGFKASPDGKSCDAEAVATTTATTETTSTTEKAEEVDENAAFKELCGANGFGGTYSDDTKAKRYDAGKVIAVEVPVQASCVLPEKNNTMENCKALVDKCPEGKKYIHYEGNICACLDDIEAKCLNGEPECRDTDKKAS